jgi:transcription termination/antitermination protein NusG
MNYYAAQVYTGHEQKFIDQIKSFLPQESNVQQFIFLQRELRVQRHGVIKNELLPLFPGYIFLETEKELDPDSRMIMRKSEYFYRFLKNNQNVTPLADNDLKILLHFMDFGEKAGPSSVYFDENQRIIVVEGPLKGLEGFIIKVDKRKKRAKIRINFEESPIIMDLSFDLIDKK